MMPFLSPTLALGSVALDAWTTLVMVGIVVGLAYLLRRSRRRGLSPRRTVDWGILIVGNGWVFAHLIDKVFYRPELLLADLSILIPGSGGYSSIGGFLGAGLILAIFFRRYREEAYRHTDTMAASFILGWTFGRVGCAHAHDHIGRLAEGFPLAVAFPPDWPRLGVELGVRHDLGLYEAVLSGAIFVVLDLLNRRPSRPGTAGALLLLLYSGPRFFLDFLRARDLEVVGAGRSDHLYAGLTPAQWGCIVLFGIGAGMLRNARRRALVPPGGPKSAAAGIEAERIR